MSINIKSGNLLHAEGYIVHGCNAQGVMGSGVAKQIRNRWPGAYEVYKLNYNLGRNTYYKAEENKIIVNAVIQQFYGSADTVYVDYAAVKCCFVQLNEIILNSSLDNVVNFPLIGCGLAHGKWEIVSKIIEETMPHIRKVLWVLK